MGMHDRETRFACTCYLYVDYMVLDMSNIRHGVEPTYIDWSLLIGDDMEFAAIDWQTLVFDKAEEVFYKKV